MIEIRPLQMVCLEILKEIDRICTKYNIQYWLEGGSMLGAVRHHGFIPWDDDLDIAMFREDYERFLKIAQKELKPEYFLQTHEIEREYPLFFAKVRKNNTYIEEECFLSLNFHKGIFVDIFPVDKLPYGVNKVKVYCKKLRILFLFYMLIERKVKTRIIRKHPILFNTIRFLLFPVSLAKEKFRRQVEKYLRKSNDLLEITHRGSLSGDQKFKWCYEVAWHKSFIKTTFEDMEINIPCGYHDILSKAYGNYMEFPPKEDQQPMHGLSYVIDCGEEKYE